MGQIVQVVGVTCMGDPVNLVGQVIQGQYVSHKMSLSRPKYKDTVLVEFGFDVFHQKQLN